MIPQTQLSDCSTLQIEVPVQVFLQSELDMIMSEITIPVLDTLWSYLLNHVSTFTALV
jgi:hypothetical protein